MKQYGEFPVLNDGKWTGEWKMQAIKVSATHWWPPSRTWAVAPATLKRDLRGRTLPSRPLGHRSAMLGSLCPTRHTRVG